MIRTIEDLAAHLGAYEDTEKSIARRVYKDTACGCPAGVEEGAIRKDRARYTVSLRLRGDNRIELEEWIGQAEQIAGCAPHTKREIEWCPVPVGLKEYLCPTHIGNGAGLEDDWTLDSAVTAGDVISGESDVTVTTVCDGNGTRYLQIRLDLEVDEPVMGTYFWVAGYCEGSDSEHPRCFVLLPCTPEAIDEAIAQAEKDGEDTWNATHGCEKCNTWSEEGFVEKPVDPNCPSCEGHGIII